MQTFNLTKIILPILVTFLAFAETAHAVDARDRPVTNRQSRLAAAEASEAAGEPGALRSAVKAFMVDCHDTDRTRADERNRRCVHKKRPAPDVTHQSDQKNQQGVAK